MLSSFACCEQGWPRDKPFTFDIAAASALCESPDYDMAALVVGFNAAQRWSLKLQVCVWLMQCTLWVHAYMCERVIDTCDM